jgi:hypothetical protein
MIKLPANEKERQVAQRYTWLRRPASAAMDGYASIYWRACLVQSDRRLELVILQVSCGRIERLSSQERDGPAYVEFGGELNVGGKATFNELPA